jgi:hypothetical protein
MSDSARTKSKQHVSGIGGVPLKAMRVDAIF